MQANFVFRPATAADTPRILDLVRLSLGEGAVPRGREYWEWKHERNPFGRSAILLAESDGTLVGLRVFMRWDWRAGVRTIKAVRAVDTATHPEWQGRGIFSGLTKALVQQMMDEGVQFIFNTPNGKSRPGYIKMGWTAIGRVDLWLRPRHPLRSALAAIQRISSRGPWPAAGHSDIDSVSVGSLCQHRNFVTFLDSLATESDSRLATSRSVDYLRWRYHETPGLDYRALFHSVGAAAAAVVFRFRDRGSFSELRVCEILVGKSSGSLDVACQLLRRLQKESSADYLSAMAAPRTRARSALARRGFLPAIRMGPIFTVRPLRSASAGIDVLSRRQWRLAIGDLELF